MSLPINTVVQGNCLEVLKTFPGQSIDFMMTSPPYYGLRDYGKELTSLVWDGKPDCQHQWQEEEHQFHTGTSAGEKQLTNRGTFHTDFSSHSRFCSLCNAWKGQLGLEPTWQMYTDHIRLICGEIKRVLKKSGSLYLNLGDTFAGSHCGKGDKTPFQNYRRIKVADNLYGKPSPQAKAVDYKAKCLMGIPWRVAFALIDDEWILRNAIIWHKPNAMPSSVKDRLTSTYEYIFHLVKSNRYYYNLDAIREQHKTSSIKRVSQDLSVQHGGPKEEAYVRENIIPAGGDLKQPSKILKRLKENILRGKGKNPGDVILTKHDIAVQRFPTVNREGGVGYTDPLHVKAYHEGGKNPGDVVRVQPEGHGHDRLGCRGPGLRPWDKRFHPNGKNPGDVLYSLDGRGLNTNVGEKGKLVDRKTQWRPQTRLLRLDGKNPGDFWDICTKSLKGAHFAVYPEAICVNPILSSSPPNGVVLDPMCGSGTTCLVAKKLGRNYIGIEINPAYVKIAKKRLAEVLG